MLYPKDPPLRSKKLREHANGQSCVHCGRNDGTVVLCHYVGLRQHQYGKGRGQKPHDYLGAELCGDCHRHFDSILGYKSIEASEQFLHAIALTWKRWIDDGLIQIDGLK